MGKREKRAQGRANTGGESEDEARATFRLPRKAWEDFKADIENVSGEPLLTALNREYKTGAQAGGALEAWRVLPAEAKLFFLLEAKGMCVYTDATRQAIREAVRRAMRGLFPTQGEAQSTPDKGK